MPLPYCPVCGAENQTCAGPSIRAAELTEPDMGKQPRLRLPRQHSRYGVTGYVGNVEVYDRPGALYHGNEAKKERIPATDKRRKSSTQTKQRTRKVKK